MTNTALITGGAGMIGSHVAERLLRDFSVVCMDDLSGGDPSHVPSGALFQWASITNALAVQRLFEKYRPRFVVHCAAMAAENLSHNCRVHTYQNNLVGAAIVINACIRHNVECLINFSSVAVYGKGTPPFREDDQITPADPYGIAKLAVDMDLRAAHQFFDGFNFATIRLQNVIGTRQNLSDKFRNVAAIMIRKGIEGKPMPIFGDGGQTRAFTPVSHIASIVEAILGRREYWNDEYNVASVGAMTVLNLGKTICRLMGIQENFQFLQERKETRHAYMDTSKCDERFSDVYAHEPLENVLSQMIAEAQSSPLPTMQKGPDIEIEKGMPPFWISGSL